MSSDDIITYGEKEAAVAVKVGTIRPRRRLGRAILVAASVLVLGFGGIFGYVDRTYARGLLPNTTINGLSVGGLTAEETIALLERDVLPQHQINIVVGETTITAAPADLGISYPVREKVIEAYSFGHESSFGSRFISTISSLFDDRTFSVEPVVDVAKLRAYVEALVQSNLKEAADATLVYNKGQVNIQSAQIGQAVDSEQLFTDLLAAGRQIGGFDVKAKVAVITPDVTEEALTSWRDSIVRLASVPVTLTAGEKTATVSTEQKLTWFALSRESETYSISLQESAVSATVAALSKKLSQTAINETVDEQGNQLSAGQDGFTLDVAATTAGLVPTLQALVAGGASAASSPIRLAATTTAVAKQRVVAQAAPTGETVAPAIDTDARFAQISLAKQKMYLFENRQLINTFAISSGKAGYETPPGVHKIYSKSTRAWSRTYSLYLPYWNAITADGGYGIHDLPEWPGGYKEPETHLGTPVSHGCIRLGTTQAKYFYEWAPLGMAVVVQ